MNVKKYVALGVSLVLLIVSFLCVFMPWGNIGAVSIGNSGVSATQITNLDELKVVLDTLDDGVTVSNGPNFGNYGNTGGFLGSLSVQSGSFLATMSATSSSDSDRNGSIENDYSTKSNSEGSATVECHMDANGAYYHMIYDTTSSSSSTTYDDKVNNYNYLSCDIEVYTDGTDQYLKVNTLVNLKSKSVVYGDQESSLKNNEYPEELFGKWIKITDVGVNIISRIESASGISTVSSFLSMDDEMVRQGNVYTYKRDEGNRSDSTGRNSVNAKVNLNTAGNPVIDIKTLSEKEYYSNSSYGYGDSYSYSLSQSSNSSTTMRFEVQNVNNTKVEFDKSVVINQNVFGVDRVLEDVKEVLENVF